MIKLRAFLNGRVHDISNYVTEVEWGGSLDTCARSIRFSALTSIDIPLSTLLVFYKGNQEIFRGYVYRRQLENPSATFNYLVYDIGEKLNKIKVSYNFKNTTVYNAVKTALNDVGIPIGSLAPANKTFSRVFVDVTLYDLIMTLYTLQAQDNKKKYFITCSKGYVSVTEKGTVVSLSTLETGRNVISSSVTEDLDSMVNKVLVVNEEGAVITNVSNKDDLKRHGLFQAVYQIKDDNDDYLANANKLLNGFETRINITGYGDIDCTTGRAIIVKDYSVGLQGVYYIDGDKHTFEQEKHTVTLELNLENVMKISEAGMTEDEFLKKKDEELSRIEQFDKEGAYDSVKVNKNE